jgi:uncharacterized membrane protein YczE
MQPTASASRRRWRDSARRRLPISVQAVSDIVIGPARAGLLTVLAALILGTIVAMFMQQEQAARQIERARLAPAQPATVQMPLN